MDKLMDDFNSDSATINKRYHGTKLNQFVGNITSPTNDVHNVAVNVTFLALVKWIGIGTKNLLHLIFLKLDISTKKLTKNKTKGISNK